MIALTPASAPMPTTSSQSEEQSGVQPSATYLPRPVSAEQLRTVLLDQLAGVSAPPLMHAPALTRATMQLRILVVEDNPVNQLVATGILEAMGHVVQVAPHGAEALEHLSRSTFDAVLMDVQMPVMDGYEATRTLRERETGSDRIPVIAMTAAAVEGERERCLDAGHGRLPHQAGRARIIGCGAGPLDRTRRRAHRHASAQGLHRRVRPC